MDESLLDRVLPGIADAAAYIAQNSITGLCEVVSRASAADTINLAEEAALRMAIANYVGTVGCGFVAIHLLRKGERTEHWFARRAALWQQWAIDLVRQVQKGLYGHG